MTTLKICGLALASAMFIIVIGREKGNIGALVSTAACVLIAASCVDEIIPVAKYIQEVGEAAEYLPYVKLLLKALGTALICETASEVCKDAGEGAIASKVELFGRLEIIAISLPLLRAALETAQNILNFS